jgi:N-acetylneuraminic acid mutarotase
MQLEPTPSSETKSNQSRYLWHSWHLCLMLACLIFVSAQSWAVSWTTAAPLPTGRGAHTTTLLPNGDLLVVGGRDTSSTLISTTERYSAATQTWSTVASMGASPAREGHTATLLSNGKLLVVGGLTAAGNALANAQLFDPQTNTWASAAPMNAARAGHTATLLANGKLLVTGGQMAGGFSLNNAEIYDPASGWSSAGLIGDSRFGHTATLLPDGKVLIVGGQQAAGSPLVNSLLATAAIYDPTNNTWGVTSSLTVPRRLHTATLLTNGSVLVTGGDNNLLPATNTATGAINSSEVFNPATGSWTSVGNLGGARSAHTASLLPNGRVMVAGGAAGRLIAGAVSPRLNVEIYDPTAQTWSATTSMGAARFGHTATILPTGYVAIVSGSQDSVVTTTVELFDPTSSVWTASANLRVRRTAAMLLMPNGRVLMAGSEFSAAGTTADVYDPATNSWAQTNDMAVARLGGTTTLLNDGRVLVAGGSATGGGINSAELYNPATGTWSSAANLVSRRFGHTATRLPDGRVLVAGGFGNNAHNSAMLYDPRLNTWTLTPNMAAQRYQHSAVLLADGRVLIIGGFAAGNNPLASAEIFDPNGAGAGGIGTWTTVASMVNARAQASFGALRLNDGRVLVTGGIGPSFAQYSSAEIYNPTINTWTAAGNNMASGRWSHQAIMLNNGRVLVFGGDFTNNSVDIFDPLSNRFSAAPDSLFNHNTGSPSQFGAVLLPNGKVFSAVGTIPNGQVIAQTEIFDPNALSATAITRQPVLAANLGPFFTTTAMTITGSGFRPPLEASGGNSNSSATNYPIMTLRGLNHSTVITIAPDAATPYSNTSFTSTANALANYPTGFATLTATVNGIPSVGQIVYVGTIGVPDAPGLGQIIAGNALVIVPFTPVVNNGGSAITGYTATCGVGGNQKTATGLTSPLTVTGLANGTAVTCTIIATNSAGNSLPAGPSNSVTPVTSQTITFNNSPIVVVGAGSTLSATGGLSGNAVTFSTTTPSACSLGTSPTANSIIITGLSGSSTCTVAANQAAGAGYTAAATVSISFTVGQGTQVGFAASATPSAILFQGTSALGSSGGNGSGAVTYASSNNAICSIGGANNDVVTGAAIGTCTITATKAATTDYFQATATVDITVSQATQTINFAALSDRVFSTTTFTVSATATSGLGVSLQSQTGATCSLSGNTVTMLTAGLCTIRATQAGNTNYAQATLVDRTFTINKAAQTITIGAYTAVSAIGGPYNLPASSSSGLALTSTSNTPTICSVSGLQMTVVKKGQCSISFNQAGNASFNAAVQSSMNIDINGVAQFGYVDAIANTTFVPSPLATITVSGYTTYLSASAVEIRTNLLVTFSTSTPLVCTVVGSTLTIVGGGSCTVLADQAGNDFYDAAIQGSVTFNVAPAAQTISFGTLANKVVGDAAFSVSATASSNLAVTFTTLTNTTCSVTGTSVTINAAGTCTIRATQTGNASYSAAANIDQSFTITPGTQTITFSPLANKVFGDAAFTVNATTNAVGLTPSYSTISTACSLTGNTVTIVSIGSCAIRASQLGNANYAAAADVVNTFNITAAPQTISFAALAGKTFGDAVFTVSATGGASGVAVTFTSTTPAVCTIATNSVTFIAAGQCTIRASQLGSTNGNYAAAADVDQTFTVAKAAQTITFAAIPNKTFGDAAFVVTVSGGASTVPVTIASTTPTVCTVSSLNVQILTSGTCSITASQLGNNNYAAATDVSRSFTVATLAQTISFAALPNAAMGSAPFTVSATATSNLAVTFTAVTTSICSLNTATNTVTLLNVGTCQIRATQAGDNRYSAATLDQSFNVTIGAQTITFVQVAATSTIATTTTPFAINATASSGLTVQFQSQTPTICSVTGAIVTITANAGVCTIRASQPGNTNFNAAPTVDRSVSVIVFVSVFNASISLTATNNAPNNSITYGNPLTLNASVAGRAPTGSVDFIALTNAGNVLICQNVTLTTSNTAACVVPRSLRNVGNSVFQANYSGDANNTAATTTLSLTITQADIVLSAAASPVKPIAGQTVTLTILVAADDPSGAITVSQAGAILPGCGALSVRPLPSVGDADAAVATCTLTNIASGDYDFVVSYPSTNNNKSAQTRLQLNVAAANTAPAIDYSDMWWVGAAENGWGLSISQHASVQFNAFYVYDAQGKPVWTVMPGGQWNRNFTSYTGPLYQPTGSAFSRYNVAEFTPGASVGSATLNFTNANNAIFSYTINGISASKNVTRQPLIDAANPDTQPRIIVNDLWWAGERENGWGINIAQQARTLFMVWYTYGVDNKTTWFTVPGGVWDGTTFSGDVYATVGSAWLGVPYVVSQYSATKVGTMIVDFEDQNKANMTTTINGVTQSRMIVRQPF